MFKKLRIYTVHIRPRDPKAHEHPVFVHEGFNFFAFALTALWALYYRLWLPALGVFIVNATLLYLRQEQYASEFALYTLQFGFQAAIGFHANDWRRAYLEKRGYVLADITASESQARAEQRYFERYLSAA